MKRTARADVDVPHLALRRHTRGVSAPGHTPPRPPGMSRGLIVMFAIATFIYFWRCEAVWGQTLGKRLCDLRVVRRDGAPTPPRKESHMLTELTIHVVNRAGMVVTAGDGCHTVTMDYPAPGAESEELAGRTPITSSYRIVED